MANIVKQGVPIRLDKVRHLFYSMKGFMYLADKHGDANAAFQKIPLGDSRMTREGLEALADLIYAGLCHEDKNLTPDDVAAMVDIRALGSVVEKINKAMTLSLPENDEEEGDPQ